MLANTLDLYGVFAGENRYFTYPNRHEVYCIDIVYTCNDFAPSGRTHDEEVLEIRWFAFDALPLNISPPVKDVIKQYIREHRNYENTEMESSS